MSNSYLWDVPVGGVCLVNEGPMKNSIVERVGRLDQCTIRVRRIEDDVNLRIAYLTSVRLFTKKRS